MDENVISSNDDSELKYDVKRIILGDEVVEFIAYDVGTKNVNTSVSDYLNMLLRSAYTNPYKSALNLNILINFINKKCNVI